MDKNVNFAHREGNDLKEIFTHPPTGLVDKHAAAALLGISPETLKKYRLQSGSTLIEGVHYHVWNSRTIRYNPDLIKDWGMHRNDPVAHQHAIEQHLSSLACNRPKKRRRKAG